MNEDLAKFAEYLEQLNSPDGLKRGMAKDSLVALLKENTSGFFDIHLQLLRSMGL
jgi:hypothetical protein